MLFWLNADNGIPKPKDIIIRFVRLLQTVHPNHDARKKSEVKRNVSFWHISPCQFQVPIVQLKLMHLFNLKWYLIDLFWFCKTSASPIVYFDSCRCHFIDTFENPAVLNAIATLSLSPFGPLPSICNRHWVSCEIFLTPSISRSECNG